MLSLPGELPSDWLATPLADLLPEDPQPEMPPALARTGAFAAGYEPRPLNWSTGFADGAAADGLLAGPELAERVQQAWEGGLQHLGDDELVGVMRAWQRLSSWTAAGQLAAVGELDRRREAQVAAGADPGLAEHTADEVAAALTLTGVGADRLLELAHRLADLPGTRAALATGAIRERQAAVIAEETSGLGTVQAAALEHLVLPGAPGQTTGQLRVAVKRAVALIDADAVVKRREAAQKEARVEVWNEPAGTASLAGRDLPASGVLAASAHLTSLARKLQDLGAEGTIDQLRARAYTALLLGQTPTELLTTTQPPHEPNPPGAPSTPEAPNTPNTPNPPNPPNPPGAPTASRAPDVAQASGGADPAAVADAADMSPAPVPAAVPAGLSGSVNLTMPLATLLGGHHPGEVPGYGMVGAEDCRALATSLASGKNRWCLTLTGTDGRALAHGCVTGHAKPHAASKASAAAASPGLPQHHRQREGKARGPDGGGWELTLTIRPLATGRCDHQRESAGYRPPESLRHLITVRQPVCSFPTCRRPATRCDLDHTLAYDKGGRTCECGLAPLCRRHHRAKQAQGWHLEQPEPGVMAWTMPHGRKYVTKPAPYP